MKSLRGKLLVATPNLIDPNFCRAVVLVIQHNAQGALGIVLNRPTHKTIQQLWQELNGDSYDSDDSDNAYDSEEPVNLGGPVAGPLMALHTYESLSEVEIFPGIHFCTQESYLHEIAHQQDHPFRIFTGYAGWTGGQLESELASGDWLTTPVTFEYIFRSEGDLWRKVIGDLADSTIFSPLDVEHIPEDPSMN